MNPLQLLVELSARHAKTALAFLLLVSALFAAGATQLGINASPYVVDASHPVRQAHEALKNTFTNVGEQALIALVFEKTAFDPDIIKRVNTLTNDLEDMSITTPEDVTLIDSLRKEARFEAILSGTLDEGLDTRDQDALKRAIEASHAAGEDEYTELLTKTLLRASPVERVRSVTSIENIKDLNGELTTEKLVPALPRTAEESARIQSDALSNPLFRKLLVSEDGKAVTVQVELRITGDDSPNMMLAYHKIIEIVEQNELSGHAYLSGVPVINAEIAKVMENDNKKFFPIVILVIFLVLYVAFRSLLAVAIALTVAILSTVWTLGSMAFCGVDHNIVTAIMPIFIISIAVADAIHFLSKLDATGEKCAIDAVKETSRSLLLPMFLTSLTTTLGFLSLAYSSLRFITEFGLFVALSVVYAFLITIVLIPACAKWINRSGREEHTESFQSQGIFQRWTTILVNHRKAFVAALLAVTTGALTQTFSIDVDNHSSAAFPADARIRLDEKVINENIGGIYPVNFWFSAKEDRFLLNPKSIDAIEKITHRIEAYQAVGRVVSPNDFLKRIYQIVGESSFSLPEPLTQEAIAQLFLLYENSNGQELNDVMDDNYRNARIIALFNTDRAKSFNEVIRDVESYARQVLPGGLEMTITGYGAEIVVATEEVVFGQIYSTLFAGVLIFLLMSYFYRSLLIGIIGMAPLLLTLFINFSAMKMFSIPLDIGTALIIGITFGVGIDYAIHYISALKIYRQEQQGWQESSVSAIADVFRPILFNSVSLSLGFLVLSLSSFTPLRQLGYFVSGSMMLCAMVTLVILPGLFCILKPKALDFKKAPSFDASETSLSTSTTPTVQG